jgi:hypothetical protein
MLRLLLVLVTVGFLVGQETPSREEVLRARVISFWKAFEEKKFRKADALVLEADKDDFAAWGKRQIYSQQKSEIKLSEDGKVAEVLTPVETDKLIKFESGAAAVRSTQPVRTFWKFENGSWWWFQPKR